MAEGIETMGQLAFLRANDCDHGQGFYLARPQKLDDAWIRKPAVEP